MNIFMCGSVLDFELYGDLIKQLMKQGNKILNLDNDFVEQSIIDKTKSISDEVDIFIVIFTENFISDSFVTSAELFSAIFGAGDMPIFVVVVGDVFVPNILSQYPLRKVSTKEEITKTVLDDIEFFKEKGVLPTQKKENANGLVENSPDEKIRPLKNALIDNQLTLVCGAGVSIDSSIPTWNQLLVNIMNDALLNNEVSKTSEGAVSAEELLSLMPQSNLILGKYLRLILQDDFERIVQKHLYYSHFQRGDDVIQSYLDTDMMMAIAELARPKRNGKRLESIITFNFDDVIEQTLQKNNIDHCAIWEEGQTCEIDALPIYHVHGFLPSRKTIDNPNLVFSEEAYHSQFIDPYSWSNLIQLNSFSSNICLFVGLSLSDPNLRRLLDISWRRNQRCKHYIIMKKEQQKSKTGEMATMLFEQDANSLGLNVIWCDKYSEISDILSQIAK